MDFRPTNLTSEETANIYKERIRAVEASQLQASINQKIAEAFAGKEGWDMAAGEELLRSLNEDLHSLGESEPPPG